MSKLHYGETAARAVSERIGGKTATTATMAAIAPADRVDGMVIVVLNDYSLWVFKGASATAGSATVIAPSTGSGRWHHLVTSAAA